MCGQRSEESLVFGCFWDVFFVQILFLQVSCVVNLGAQSFSCYGKIFISTSVTSVG